MPKTSHFHISPPWVYSGETQSYVMFSYFVFDNDEYRPGQSETVRAEEAPSYIAHLVQQGRTHAEAAYINGKWQLRYK